MRTWAALEDARKIAEQTGQKMVAVDCPQPPTVEPENADVFDAFNRVAGCNHPVMSAGMGPPIWSDIRTVLELHELWTPEIQERLGKLLSMIREHTNTEAAEKPLEPIDLEGKK